MSGPDDAAFTAYVAEHAPRLLSLAYLMTGGDRGAAEDLLQSALERTYRRWPRLAHGASTHAYVRRAIVNGAIDRHRRSVRETYDADHSGHVRRGPGLRRHLQRCGREVRAGQLPIGTLDKAAVMTGTAATIVARKVSAIGPRSTSVVHTTVAPSSWGSTSNDA